VEESNKLSYFFLGMGLGVAIGILFAPKSGEETRQLIRDKADEGRGRVKQHADDVRTQAGGIVERGRDVVSKQRDQLSKAVEAGKSAYRDAVEPAPSEAQETEAEGF
jgi:gas vesicle protein